MHQGVAGDGAAGLSLWNPSSPQHHAARRRSREWGLTRLSPVSHSPVPGTAQTGATRGRTGTPGPCSPLLLVRQHGLRDGELVREAGSGDELGNAACNVHSVCGHKEP